MAIKISARQFYDNSFVESIKEALATTGMNPRLLELEITESMLLQNVQRTASIFAEIKKLGVKIVVDDFGTGYSSLSDLNALKGVASHEQARFIGSHSSLPFHGFYSNRPLTAEESCQREK